MNSNELIELLKKRDRKAIEKVYDQYAPALYGIILRIVKAPVIAENVLEETFIKILEDIHSYKDQTTLFTWMCCIAKSSARQNKPTPVSETEPISLASVETPRDLVKAFSTLEGPCQKVIKHMLFDGHTLKQTSDDLHLPLEKIKEHLRCGLRHIYKTLPGNSKILLVSTVVVLSLYF